MLASRKRAKFIDKGTVPVAAFKLNQTRFTSRRKRHGPHFFGACGPGCYRGKARQISLIMLNLIDTRRARVLGQVDDRLQPVYFGCLSLYRSPLGWRPLPACNVGYSVSIAISDDSDACRVIAAPRRGCGVISTTSNPHRKITGTNRQPISTEKAPATRARTLLIKGGKGIRANRFLDSLKIGLAVAFRPKDYLESALYFGSYL